jgi:hypothetical protein
VKAHGLKTGGKGMGQLFKKALTILWTLILVLALTGCVTTKPDADTSPDSGAALALIRQTAIDEGFEVSDNYKAGTGEELPKVLDGFRMTREVNDFTLDVSVLEFEYDQYASEYATGRADSGAEETCWNSGRFVAEFMQSDDGATASDIYSWIGFVFGDPLYSKPDPGTASDETENVETENVETETEPAETPAAVDEPGAAGSKLEALMKYALDAGWEVTPDDWSLAWFVTDTIPVGGFDLIVNDKKLSILVFAESGQVSDFMSEQEARSFEYGYYSDGQFLAVHVEYDPEEDAAAVELVGKMFKAVQ